MNHQDRVKTPSAYAIFLLLWFGAFINAIGSGMTVFGLTVYLFNQTHSTSLISLISVVGLLPRVLLLPYAGVLADKYDRRLLMILGDGLSGLGTLLILWQVTKNDQNYFLIFLGLMVSSIFTSLTQPAFKATISDILSKEDYSKAAGMVQINDTVGFLICPFLAGYLLKISSLNLILLLDFSTLLVTLICTLIVKQYIPHQTMQNSLSSDFSSLKEGWSYLKNNKGVLALIIKATQLTFFMGFIQVLITPLILTLTNAETLGKMMSIAASGALIMSIFLGIVPLRKNFLKILRNALIINGIMMILIGLSTDLTWMTLFAFCFFSALAFANTPLDYLIRTNVEENYLGRVMGFAGNISQLGYILAFALAGILADYIFNPLLVEGGPLAGSLGQWFGVGELRGTGLLISLAGCFLCGIAITIFKNQTLLQLKE